jgi:hypothetical protein
MAKAKRIPRVPRNAIKLAELGLAAPQVIAHRLTRMTLAGPVLSARDRKEFAGMVIEKQVAIAAAWTAMLAESVRWQQTLALSFLTGASARQHAARAKSAAARLAGSGLAPVHRKAVANAKRLARTKLR